MKKAYINAVIPYTSHDAFVVEEGMFKSVGRKSRILNVDIDEIIDLKHQTVLPGFNDSHMHLLGLGWQMSLLDTTLYHTIDEIIKAAQKFEEPIIIGRGFHEENVKEKRPLNKTELNAISSDKPVIIYRACGHVVFANDVAIERANQQNSITASEDSYHMETGVFKEDAIKHILSIVANPDQTQIKHYMLNAQAHLLKHGITAIGSDDFHIFKGLPFEVVNDAYKDLVKDNKLHLNVLQQVNLPNIDDLTRFLASSEAKARYGTYHLGPLKILADGSLGGRSAYMKTPYHDDPSTKGIEIFDHDALLKRIQLARTKQMDFAIHAIGDQTIETLINIKETLNDTDTNPYRDSIIHAQLADYAQIKRMKEAKLGAQTQPIFLNSDIPIIQERLGERALETYLFKTMINTLPHTTISTDAPIEHVNPFENLYTAITRKSIKHPDLDPFLPKEALPLNRALKAYTATPAQYFYLENALGKIKSGYQADFIIVEGLNINEPDSLLNTTVKQTYHQGLCVYSKEADNGTL